MAEDAEDKSQAATGRKLQQAREQGNVPLSRDMAGLASFGVGLSLLIFLGAHQAAQLSDGLQYFFITAGNFSISPGESLRHAVLLIARAVGPLVLGVMAAGLAATWLQTGFLFHLGAIGFDLTRLSPMNGLKRIFSANHVVEMIKSIAKLVVLGFAVSKVLMADVPSLGGALHWSATQLMARLLQDFTRIVMAMVLAQGLIVGADLGWVRLKHARDLRMSREDVKQEQKDIDGDPHVKGKRKRIRFQRARRRMMAAVPKATVVITNPTHYAIALAYERGGTGAPRVVAKGVDEVAANIRAMAQLHHVPLVQNPPLARALYLVELDAEIPAEHFKAVAEIIAYVWRLSQSIRTPVL